MGAEAIEERGPARFAREAAGVVLLFSGLFLALTLIRYNPADPGIGDASIGVVEIHNLGGVIGAKVSNLMVQFIGCAAFAFPLVLVYCARLLFFRREVRHLWWKLAAFLPWMVALAAIIDLVWGKIAVLGTELDSGGFLGAVISSALVSLFNRPGAAIVLVMMWILLTMLTTGGSLAAAARWSAARSAAAADSFKRLWMMYRERKARHEALKEKLEEARNRPAPTIVDKPPPALDTGKGLKIKEREQPKQESFEFVELGRAGFELPAIKLLDDPPDRDEEIDRESIMMNARLLEKKLGDYSVKGEVVEVHPGPVINTYEFLPAPGIKVHKIVNLSDDLSLALSAINVRIVAPIPGKGVVGIEIPNRVRHTVFLKEVLGCEDFAKKKSKLILGLGKDTEGFPVVVDLQKMPHLLVAGATGSGKSVSLNSMITSILYKATPEETRFIMIDLKRLELGIYEGIPHLLHPVITSPKEAAAALKWAVGQMEERYRLMAELGVRSIDNYNRAARKSLEETKKQKRKKPVAVANDGEDSEPTLDKPVMPLPYIVIIIDELADLMMVAAREVEESIARLAQMARAAGIHLILATQRPSVDVLTGLIKANFPARISFQVASRVDSRTILDTNGAERLLGYGDMLLLAPGTHRLQRVHGAYLSEPEINRIVEFLKGTGTPEYDDSIVVAAQEDQNAEDVEDYDERYDEAVHIVTQTRQASISMLQRKLRVGYNRAARMIEKMEREGIVGPSDGVRPRDVLIDPIQMEK